MDFKEIHRTPQWKVSKAPETPSPYQSVYFNVCKHLKCLYIYIYLTMLLFNFLTKSKQMKIIGSTCAKGRRVKKEHQPVTKNQPLQRTFCSSNDSQYLEVALRGFLFFWKSRFFVTRRTRASRLLMLAHTESSWHFYFFFPPGNRCFWLWQALFFYIASQDWGRLFRSKYSDLYFFKEQLNIYHEDIHQAFHHFASLLQMWWAGTGSWHVSNLDITRRLVLLWWEY